MGRYVQERKQPEKGSAENFNKITIDLLNAETDLHTGCGFLHTGRFGLLVPSGNIEDVSTGFDTGVGSVVLFDGIQSSSSFIHSISSKRGDTVD